MFTECLLCVSEKNVGVQLVSFVCREHCFNMYVKKEKTLLMDDYMS